MQKIADATSDEKFIARSFGFCFAQPHYVTIILKPAEPFET